MANATGSNSTLFRGMKIMQQVAEANRGLSIAELVELIGLPKPTVHRIAIQLEEEGFLLRGPDKRFVVGAALKNFALNVQANHSVGAPRHAILEQLSQEVGETCNCTMLDGNRTVYFDRVEYNWPIKIDLHLGSRLPLHATASGKLFLAFMKPSERKRLLQAAPLSKNTEQTITSLDELEEQLKHIRKEGVGFDNEELLAGMVAISVPVFNPAKRICFTVAVHAPTSRKNLDDLRECIPALRRAAESLSASYCEEEG